MAESSMCMPFMRAQAETRTNRLIESSPNGIVILDENMLIKSMNPAFRKMFYCGEAILNKPISYLVDSQPFEQLISEGKEQLEEIVEYHNYNISCHLIVYRLENDNRYVGIFVNITELKQKESQIEKIRAEANAQAQELVEHQMEMAQQLTRFLGESSVKGEALVKKMMLLVNQKGD